mgnify:CR=1 FL=1
MPQIVPISHLKSTSEISERCHSAREPIFITKNGYGDMVVLSIEAYENLQFESEVYFKLREAEQEAQRTDQRYSSKDVLKAMREAMEGDTIV